MLPTVAGMTGELHYAQLSFVELGLTNFFFFCPGLDWTGIAVLLSSE
jgi:hypothetical protein